jgi:iron complex outermembrane recepter protein
MSSFVPVTAPQQGTLLARSGADAGPYSDAGRKDKKLMPAIALQQDLLKDVMAYASYSKGFKAGGYSIGLSKAEFGPETVDAYEIGLKSTLFDKALTLNLAAFYSNYKDLQESVIYVLDTGVIVNTVGNVARSVSKGLEFSGQYHATPALTFNVDASYLSAKYVDYTNAPCTTLQTVQTKPGSTCVQDLSNKNRAFSPKMSGNFGVQYVHSLGDNVDLIAGGNVFFSSSFFAQSTNDPLSEQSGYALLDANLGLASPDRKWEASLIGKNLADKTTFNYWSTLPGALGSGQALVDRPRSFAAQFSLRF